MPASSQKTQASHCSPMPATASILSKVGTLETLHEALPPYSEVAENEWEKASPSLALSKTLSQAGWQRSDLTIDTLRTAQVPSKYDDNDATPTTAQSDVNPGALCAVSVAHAMSTMSAYLQPERPRLQRRFVGHLRFDLPESATKPDDQIEACTSRPSTMSAIPRERKATPFPKHKTNYFSEPEGDDEDVDDVDEEDEYECSIATITPSSSS